MLIIPAIDLKGGRCVRLWQGRRDRETVYAEDPLAVAKRWEKEGARRLHVVDLDGAFEGKPRHLEIVEKMAKEVGVPLEFGGGIRDFSILEEVFKRGIDYAILGSQALSLRFVERVCREFGERIIVSLDTREGKVVIQGWEKKTSIPARDLAEDLVKVGVRTMIFTDISRDGTMEGANIKAMQDFAQGLEANLILSGGISSLEEVRKITRLSNLGVAGMIIGKALYSERISLKEAIAIGSQSN